MSFDIFSILSPMLFVGCVGWFW